MSAAPSPWLAIEAQLEADLTSQFAERIMITPLASDGPFSSPEPDPARPAFEASGVLIVRDAYAAEVSGVEGRVQHEEHRVEIPRANLPAGWALRANDLVEALDYPDLGPLQIDRVDATQRARIVLILGPIG